MFCDVCGKDDEQVFHVIVGDEVRTFDCVECLRAGSHVERKDPVDLASEASFPASDPPAWNAGDARGRPVDRTRQRGRVGYLVLYLFGAPVGLLLLSLAPG